MKYRSMVMRNVQNISINWVSFGELELVIRNWNEKTETMSTVKARIAIWWLRYIAKEIKVILQRHQKQIDEVRDEMVNPF